MITFSIAIVLLILGYLVYGAIVEKIFGTDKDRKTPCYTCADGVDYIPMKTWKVYLIQFLNIAGTGPIFGAIQGILFGPAAYLWIVFGCIFGGAVHDFLSGMISMRENGASLPELVGKELGDKVRCMLVGPFDSNPSALKPQELQPLIDSGVIEYFGEQSDVRPFIAQASRYVLPSYHEGTPKTVLENMAMGRPIITTDVPGCRETVVNGSNGYLVQAKNVDALVDKMQYLAQHPDLVLKMGRKSREMAESTFESMPAWWFSVSISDALRPTVSFEGSRILSLYL